MDCGELINPGGGSYDLLDGWLCELCAIENGETSVTNMLNSHSSDVMNTERFQGTAGDKLRSDRAVGIELETYSPGAMELHDVKTELPSQIAYKADGSLNMGGVEIVTPPFAGKKGEKLVGKITQAVNDNDFVVNHTCGFHLHVDMSDVVSNEYTDVMYELKELEQEVEALKQAKRVFDDTEQREMIKQSLYRKKDEVTEFRRELDDNYPDRADVKAIQALMAIYIAVDPVIQSFVPATRRSNSYCSPVAQNYSIREVLDTSDIAELEKIHYNTENYSQVRSAKQRGTDRGTRHRGINLHTMFSDGHFEVRYHTGTTNEQKIIQWCNLHARIADKAVNDYKEVLSTAGTIAQEATSLTEQTRALFDLIDLNENEMKYLLARQRKFKKQAKGELADMTVEELLEDLDSKSMFREEEELQT
jgi:hypothetical protein